MADPTKEPLRDVSETLATELKSWLRPDSEKDAALLARALLALRNNDGGQIVIGIDDKTLNGIEPPADLGDIRERYHADKLNKIVANYAMSRFEVRVEFREYQGRLHPRIVVAGGITAPVLSRREFPGELRQNAVYVRTISMGRVSSCEPVTIADWERLISICFDNREANVGRFLRRHLPAMIDELGLNTASPQPKSAELALAYLDTGRTQFDASEGAST